MYQQLTIAHPYLSDQAEIFCSSQQGSLPAGNLLRSPYPTDVWRSLGAPGTVIMDIHLPESDVLLWNLIAPGYTNSGPDATLQAVAAFSRAGLDDPTYEGPAGSMWTVPNMIYPGAPDWRHALRFLKADQRTEPWVRLIINDPSPVVPVGVVSPFMQWGRLYVALGWQPSYHHDKGSQLQPANEKSRRVTTQGGGTRMGSSARPRRYQFNVAFLTRDEMLTRGYEIDRLVGTSGDLLVIDNPDDPAHLDKYMIFGTLPDATAEKNDDYESFSRSYTLEELL